VNIVLVSDEPVLAALARRPLELRLPGRTIAVDVETAAEADGDVVVTDASPCVV
jgi:hypothetical protein